MKPLSLVRFRLASDGQKSPPMQAPGRRDHGVPDARTRLFVVCPSQTLDAWRYQPFSGPPFVASPSYLPLALTRGSQSHRGAIADMKQARAREYLTSACFYPSYNGLHASAAQ